MARVPYIDRDDVAPEYRPIYDRLIAERGLPIHNLFRALANTPPIMDQYLRLSKQLRFETRLDGKLRELVIMAVGWATRTQYEYTQHWHVAEKLGISAEKLEAIPNFETSPLFTPQERAIIRYALEVTRNIAVSDATVAAVRETLDTWQFMELTHIIAFYNMVVRLLQPLGVELEPDKEPKLKL
jgi:alkylhydroperoxidase family enzyme